MDPEKQREDKLDAPIPPSSQSSLHEDEKLSTTESPEAQAPAQPVQQDDVESKAALGSAAISEPTPNAKPAHGHVNDLSSVPNGGLRAWLQVAGAFMLFFNTWGVINTWGIYQTYYSIDILKHESSSTIAWIGSLQAFLLLFVGALTGPIYDGGYFRGLIVTGSFLVVFGHMMLSLCHEYWQVLLAQGFCIGLGFACLFVPSVAILSTYFTTKIAAATGIAASGSSLGGVLYPIILNRLIPEIGFPWAVRTIGFICFGTLLLPNIVMKVRVLPPTRRSLIDPTAFKHVPFVIFCISSFTTFMGLFQPLFFVQDFAIANNLTTENLAFYLLSILNATSVFGRILPNILADKIGPFNVIVPCAIITGILILTLVAVHNVGGVIVFVLLFGFFSGSLVSLPPTVVVHLTKDRRFIGTRMGMCFSFTAIGALVSTPIGGALLKVHNDFWPTWTFGGVLAVSGGILMGVSRGMFKGWNIMTKA